MKKNTLINAGALMILILAVVVPSAAYCLQAGNVSVRLEGSRAVVTYDIPGNEPVGVNITFADDRGPLEASPGSLKGDFGDNVSPGNGKVVYWEFLRDHPYGLMAQVLQAQVILTGSGRKESRTHEKGEKMTKIRIETNKGVIVAQLDAQKAPVSVENFLSYAKDGHYDGTIFHRVIDGFMIQGGGFDENMQMKKTLPPIRNEAANGLKNEKGTLAMARTSVVDSATSQFFINLVDNAFLDHKNESPAGFGYAVFGKVVEGIDVVEEIGKVQTGNFQGFQDVPVEPVVIEKVTVVE